ncbi:hemolysin family protein [Leptolyngbya sp. 15MV]|nr:hemolysin family protein [Leptolyngbya sp. 15MV]
MTPFPWTDLLVIAGLILINGVFAMSELAIVSARTSHLRARADKGSRAAATAIALAADPGKFLSTVQIGITLVGIIAGAYSGASLGGPVGERLAALGVPAAYSGTAGFALVIALTTYASLVVGELVPKQVALRAAVPIATVMARPMAAMARVAAPLVWLLDKSSGLLIRLLGVGAGGQASVTAEELHMIFAEATRSGVIEADQHQILAGVVRLAERPVREVMTPRTELDWIDLGSDEAAIRQAIADSPHSLLPVADGSPDRIVGVVKAREVLARMLNGQPVALAALMRKAEVVPDQLDAMDALRVLQQSEIAMAMVHDEYGHLDGIVTPVDLLTAIAGTFVSDQDPGDAPEVVERADGSLLVSGAMNADALADRLGLEYGEDREFATVAGYVLAVLKHLPKEGESFIDQGWRFEVVDLDHHAARADLAFAGAQQPVAAVPHHPRHAHAPSNARAIALRGAGEGEGREQRIGLALDRAEGAADHLRREVGRHAAHLGRVQNAHIQALGTLDRRFAAQHGQFVLASRDHQPALGADLQFRRVQLRRQLHPAGDARHHQVQRRCEAVRPAFALVQEGLHGNLRMEAAGVVARRRGVDLALLQQQHIRPAIARQVIGHRAAGEATANDRIVRRGVTRHG